MSSEQLFLFLTISLLLTSKASRKDAFVLFVAYLIYQHKVIALDATSYYLCTSLLNLCVGLYLHHKNKLAAICAYALVPVNLFGFWLWYQYAPPYVYDKISLVILIIQVIAILPKELLNGRRYNSECFMAQPDGFNRF